MVINRISFKKENLHLKFLSWIDKLKGFSTSFTLLLDTFLLYKSSLYLVINETNFSMHNKLVKKIHQTIGFADISVYKPKCMSLVFNIVIYVLT
jgi:hypothetical protein